MATLSAYEGDNTIELKISLPSIYRQVPLDAAMTDGLLPGSIVIDDGAIRFSYPDADAVITVPLVVVENADQGKGIQDPYLNYGTEPTRTRAKARLCRRGDYVLARYTDIGVTVTYGDRLVTDTNTGGLKGFVEGIDDSGAILFEAAETITTPATATLLKVMAW